MKCFQKYTQPQVKSSNVSLESVKNNWSTAWMSSMLSFIVSTTRKETGEADVLSLYNRSQKDLRLHWHLIYITKKKMFSHLRSIVFTFLDGKIQLRRLLVNRFGNCSRAWKYLCKEKVFINVTSCSEAC